MKRQWKRDDSAAIHPNPNFPDMKALAANVHSKGLKIGIYSSPGPATWGGYTGSYGHEQQMPKPTRNGAWKYNRDLWTHENLGAVQLRFSAKVHRTESS